MNQGLRTFGTYVTDEAREMLKAIAKADKRIAAKLVDLMEDLAKLPEQKGSLLVGELAGLHSHHAIGNRFSIIYEIDLTAFAVTIISVGMRTAKSRHDIYEKTKRIRAKAK